MNKILVMFFSSIFAVGCVPDSRSDDKSSSDVLSGTWKRGCYIDSEGDAVTETLRIDSGQAYASITWYEFYDCSGFSYRYERSGTYNIGEELTLYDGGKAKKFDRNVTKITDTPLTEAAVILYNSNNLCNRTDWKANVAVDVTSCSHHPVASVTIWDFYDVFHIDGRVVYFGDNDYGAGTNDQNRPTALETRGYTKQ
jgi:hypothetical protein